MRRGMKKCLMFALGGLLAASSLVKGLPSAASSRAQANSVDLYQALLDLQNPWTVMCVAAHPDDEDGATLTILRRKNGVHTVSVFSTFGEGGQNAVGPELYEELGAIRAKETQEAATIQGSQPYFLGLRDFGFSKSAEEAFRIWGHDVALQRLVLKVRELRPDVIITNHDTVSGHGHHQATGRLVLEAFDAAADARRFPEQLQRGLSTWQAQRLFVRFQFQAEAGSKSAEDEAARSGKVVSFDPNERDQMRNKTYAEQALEALQRHATQGPWPKTLPAGGRPVIRYRLVRSAKDAAPLPAKAQSVLEGLELSPRLTDELTPVAVRALIPIYSANAHRAIFRGLIALRRVGMFATPTRSNDEPRFRLMKSRLDSALRRASAIEVGLIPANTALIPGTTTHVTLRIANRGESDATLRGISLRGLLRPTSLMFPKMLRAGSTISVELLSPTSRRTGITVPAAEHLYDGKLLGEELSATVNVEIAGATFPITEMLRLDVAPAVEIAGISPSPLVTTTRAIVQPKPYIQREPTGGEPDGGFTLRLVNHLNKPFKGSIVVEGAPVPKTISPSESITLAANESREIRAYRLGGFVLEGAGKTNVQPTSQFLTFKVVANDSSKIVTQRRVQVVWTDARVPPNLRVGYIRSFDETLRYSLRALGVPADELTVDDVRMRDLSSYQTIIIDNRGYQAHPELIAANSRLLDYVRDGGTLIVFYHRTNEWNPDPRVARPQLAPYPITIGNARVTDETAPISFTDAAHSLLNYPNKITQQDFSGWIQERGLYYPATWDSHYSAPLAMSDHGEEPLHGGLLAADYGRGHYIYTSMVWYRQLRAGLPGAYRMLANMISYGRGQTMNAER